MIELSDVCKSYNRGAVRAVDHLSFTVNAGEIVGFVGPNGAGKTTTIKMMVGLLRPDAGTVSVAGHDLATDPLAAKRLPDGHIPRPSGRHGHWPAVRPRCSASSAMPPPPSSPQRSPWSAPRPCSTTD